VLYRIARKEGRERLQQWVWISLIADCDIASAENHMSVKNGTRGLPIADCDIASARNIAHMCLKGSGADCDIADGFIASAENHMRVKSDTRVSPMADCDIADGFIASGIYHVVF